MFLAEGQITASFVKLLLQKAYESTPTSESTTNSACD